jgi:maleylpyruvate isomerase
MPEPGVTRGWMTAGQDAVEAAITGLDDVAVAQPSMLPDWTRGHVLSHLARNAEALSNLVTWARTGVETPMYASPEARDADIDAGAGIGADALRADVHATAAAFASAFDALTPEQLTFRVVTRGGLSRPVSDIVWMRVREVWLHLVDLGTGATMADVPADVCAALADDVLRTFRKREDVSPFTAQVTDTGEVVQIGAGGPAVAADARTMTGWLTGRGPAPAGAPELPAWL